MGHLGKDGSENRVNKSQSIIATLARALIYLISFAIIATLFAQSFSWLLRGIDQFKLIGEFHQMSGGRHLQALEAQTPSYPIFSLLALPSLLTWFFGIVAAKIGNCFVDFCWQKTKQAMRKAWHRVKSTSNTNH